MWVVRSPRRGRSHDPRRQLLISTRERRISVRSGIMSSRLPSLSDQIATDVVLREAANDCGVQVASVVPLQRGRSGPLARYLSRSSGGAVTRADLLIEIAVTDVGRRQLRNEIAGRQWASVTGVRTPSIFAYDPDGDWMIGEAATEALLDIAYVDAALEQADLIGGASLGPRESDDTRSWRSARLSKLARASLVAAGGLSVPLFLRSRQAYHSLPFDRPVHGDFYFLNVPQGLDGSPTVVDWEYLGWGPRFSDAARMWASLPDLHLRSHLMDRLLSQCESAQARIQLGVVVRWMAVRQIGENLSSLRHRSEENVKHAWSILPEALALAKELGAQ